MKVAIAHAGWLPDRKRTLSRMLEVLPEGAEILTSHRREHAAIWARRAWEWIAAQSEPVILLNDDLLLHPRIAPICETLYREVPEGTIISLHTQAPGAVDVARDGHHWCRCYWYTGPAVILSPDVASSLLDWPAPWEFIARLNEDNVAIYWMWANQRPAYSTIPALAIHDTRTQSTLGYDDHPFRTPSVPPIDFGVDIEAPGYWKLDEPPPHVPNPWMPPAHMEYVRRVLAAGRSMCVLCQQKEGAVGDAKVGRTLCGECLTKCFGAIAQGIR